MPLSFQIREALIEVFRTAFWYKDPFRDFLLSCGVSLSLYGRCAEGSKVHTARCVLDELDKMGEEGYFIQRRIVTELCKLRNIVDQGVPDRDAGLHALRRLKALAVEQKLTTQAEQAVSQSRQQQAQHRLEELKQYNQKLKCLYDEFVAMSALADKDEATKRGYDLEELLAKLFELSGISYRRPYKAGTQQIDGHFNYKGFDYLVEAKWHSHSPSATELESLKSRVVKKFEGTRGLFVSMAPFRDQVISDFTSGTRSNILLMDGYDLVLILEGRISLSEALDVKIEKAAQEGTVFFSLRNLL